MGWPSAGKPRLRKTLFALRNKCDIIEMSTSYKQKLNSTVNGRGFCFALKQNAVTVAVASGIVDYAIKKNLELTLSNNHNEYA